MHYVGLLGNVFIHIVLYLFYSFYHHVKYLHMKKICEVVKTCM